MPQLSDVSSKYGAPHGRVEHPAGFQNRPCAAAGLISYRCSSPYGWIMIGAKDHTEALSEARRSYDGAAPHNLQIWDASQQSYIPIAEANGIPPKSVVIKFNLTRVRLDAGGYDSGGAYWGIGAPLYWACGEVGGIMVDRYFRACGREAAKNIIRKEYPDASFYR